MRSGKWNFIGMLKGGGTVRQTYHEEYSENEFRYWITAKGSYAGYFTDASGLDTDIFKETTLEALFARAENILSTLDQKEEAVKSFSGWKYMDDCVSTMEHEEFPGSMIHYLTLGAGKIWSSLSTKGDSPFSIECSTVEELCEQATRILQERNPVKEKPRDFGKWKCVGDNRNGTSRMINEDHPEEEFRYWKVYNGSYAGYLVSDNKTLNEDTRTFLFKRAELIIQEKKKEKALKEFTTTTGNHTQQYYAAANTTAGNPVGEAARAEELEPQPEEKKTMKSILKKIGGFGLRRLKTMALMFLMFTVTYYFGAVMPSPKTIVCKPYDWAMSGYDYVAESLSKAGDTMAQAHGAADVNPDSVESLMARIMDLNENEDAQVVRDREEQDRLAAMLPVMKEIQAERLRRSQKLEVFLMTDAGLAAAIEAAKLKASLASK